MRKAVLPLISIFFLLPGQYLIGQTGSSQSNPSADLNLQAPLVLVPALITTKTGDPVFALTKADFVLTDNGKPRAFSLEDDANAAPLALVIAVETGGAGAREFDKYGPLFRLLDSTIGVTPHQVAVVAFDSQPELALDFTPSVETAVEAIDNLMPGCSRQQHMEDCEAPGSVHDLSTAHNGAAILDGLDYSIQLLRDLPGHYRRVIMLLSETVDRGSHFKLEDAVRELNETDTAIYAIAFSTSKSEAAHYAHHQLPLSEGGWPLGENPRPNPPHGCMGKDPNPEPDDPTSKWSQFYDCVAQLVPPLTFAKMATIATAESLLKNIPATVARLTGGEYFKMTDSKSLERSMLTIARYLPNRYVLSFRPDLGDPGYHAIKLRLPNYPNLNVAARTGYWIDSPPKTQ